MKILIDNGHGLMTAGKRSPGGQFLRSRAGKQAVVDTHVDCIVEWIVSISNKE